MGQKKVPSLMCVHIVCTCVLLHDCMDCMHMFIPMYMISTGYPGDQGVPGQDGESGAPGVPGLNGFTGVRGSQGPPVSPSVMSIMIVSHCSYSSYFCSFLNCLIMCIRVSVNLIFSSCPHL